jgi:hypothetical protein
MSELLLRGSLANVTMASLTDEEQRDVSEVIEKIANHPEMVRHKNRFMKELGVTIGADYHDDRRAAEEEFKIAIWRATVGLLYHRKYTFQCCSCGSMSYKTKTGQHKPLDRRYPACPNCNNVRVTHQGETNFAEGSYVQHEKFQDSYKDFTPAQDAPRCESPIKSIPGPKVYSDTTADTILNDDRQLVKFFGEYVWNYFRQTLKENNRAEHRKTPQRICGPADWVIVQEFLSLCSRMRLNFNYCSKTQPEKGVYHIAILGLRTPPEFSAEFAALRQKGVENGIIVECTDSMIMIHQNSDAPDLEAYIIKPEHVLILDGYASESDSDDDGKSFTISQASYRTVGTERMKLEDHVEEIDTSDVIEAVRASLPDGECKQVFDIWAGRGQVYYDFSESFGDGRACINHIARHLGITTRAVNQYKDTIKVNMLAHGMMPE